MADHAPSPAAPDMLRAWAEFLIESGAASADDPELASLLTPSPAPAARSRPPPQPSAPATQSPGPAADAPRPRRKPPDPISLARTLAAEAATLEDLKTAIERFDHCPLKEAARHTVVCDGVYHAPVMAIGEAPGEEEDAQGLPFVGRSGQLLDRMLAAIGVSRSSNLYITNLIYWRPPRNRDPSPEEVAVCAPFLARQIELKQPRLILTLGKPAAQAVLKTDEGILRLRGRTFEYSAGAGSPPTPVIPLLHPSYLLRRPQDKRLAWEDLQRVASLLDALGVDRPGAL